MLWIVAAVLLDVAIAVTLIGGPRRFLRGHHVSRPIVRRLGVIGAARLRVAVGVLAVALVVFGYILGFVVVVGALAAWGLDDLLTGGDDDHQRKHEWAKRVKLRMPRPVRLRPAERWGPVPA